MSNNPDKSAPILEARGIYKTFQKGKQTIEVLSGLDLKVWPGQQIALMGASGAGKSTLLHILGTLDRPTQGEIFYFGKIPPFESDQDLSLYRNKYIGFVFQFHHLLPEFTALENVMLPCFVGGHLKSQAQEIAQEMLKRLDLGNRLTHYPGELSGGEQQRVALGRALVQKPKILIADEPTGNLDRENGEKIYNLLLELNREMGITVILATHNKALANRMDQSLLLMDGKLGPG